MDLNRRTFLLGLSLSGGVAACSSLKSSAEAPVPYIEIARWKGEGEGRRSVLVCMPETPQTREVWTGLSDELGQEFDLVAVRVEGRSGASVIAEGMRRHRPAGVVLMNNPTVTAYRRYQRESGIQVFPPTVIVMTSFLDGQQHQVSGVAGISYEVPLITVVTTLRRLIRTPIERVGVVLRAPLRGFVERQAGLALREQISVRQAVVSAAPNASELKWALRQIKRHVDAIWILNDDRLLTSGLIADGWLPGLNERPWVPAIVGAASLVSPAHSFGTFAVLPDHTALGVQTANLVFDIAASRWTLPDGPRVELPLSTTTTVDLVQARERFSLRDDALEQVDKILE